MNARARPAAHFALLCIAVFATLTAFASTALAQGVPVEPGKAPVAAFLPSSGCGCHGPLAQDWSQSMHAKALIDPVFLAKLAEGQAATKNTIGALCNKCHGPVATITGEIGGNLSPVSAEAITCMFCHQTVGLQGEPANTAHLVEPSGTRRAQIENPAAPHPAAFSEFHRSAEICGGCHNVVHPVTKTHLEATYAEWKAGPYAAEGVVCQDCHMGAEAGVVGPSAGQACSGGPQRDNIYRMSFIGANVAQGGGDSSVALLKSAATVEVDIPDLLAPGTEASVTVKVTNKGAGHYLPTGLTEFRQMWLSVYAEDAEGNKTELGERRFGTALKDAEGKFPVEMWDAAGIQLDDRIPPRESVAQGYTFKMPEGAKEAKVVAALYYKSVPDDLAAKAGVENPTTEMASGAVAIFASQADKDAAAKQGAEEAETGGSTSNPLVIAVIIGAVVLAGLGVYALVRRKK